MVHIGVFLQVLVWPFCLRKFGPGIFKHHVWHPRILRFFVLIDTCWDFIEQKAPAVSNSNTSPACFPENNVQRNKQVVRMNASSFHNFFPSSNIAWNIIYLTPIKILSKCTSVQSVGRVYSQFQRNEAKVNLLGTSQNIVPGIFQLKRC